MNTAPLASSAPTGPSAPTTSSASSAPTTYAATPSDVPGQPPAAPAPVGAAQHSALHPAPVLSGRRLIMTYGTQGTATHESCRDSGASLVMVTHDTKVAAVCRRTVAMRDGRIAQEFVRPDAQNAQVAQDAEVTR